MTNVFHLLLISYIPWVFICTFIIHQIYLVDADWKKAKKNFLLSLIPYYHIYLSVVWSKVYFKHYWMPYYKNPRYTARMKEMGNPHSSNHYNPQELKFWVVKIQAQVVRDEQRLLIVYHLFKDYPKLKQETSFINLFASVKLKKINILENIKTAKKQAQVEALQIRAMRYATAVDELIYTIHYLTR